MAITIKKATRTQAKARVALIGPSGSGKTYSALLMALTLAGGRRVVLVDTEHGSASKYAELTDPRTGLLFDFDVIELDSFAPDTYVDAIEAATKAGAGAVVIDSLSHAWAGKDGALEMVDKAAKKSGSGNSFAAWRDITPRHNRLVEALSACPTHLVVTMRSKMEYVLEQVEGKNGRLTTQPKKVGLAPIQREGLEYEFDVVGDIDLDHHWAISKTRCPAFDGAVIEKPGVKFAEEYSAWLHTGAAPAPKALPAPAAAPRAVSTNRKVTFSRHAKWEGAEQWNGKPLDAAPLAVLEQYHDYVRVALERATDARTATAYAEHLRHIEAEMALKEPQVEREPDVGDEPPADESADLSLRDPDEGDRGEAA